MSVRDKLCRWFCDRRYDDTPPHAEHHSEIPAELREASHRMANATANFHAVAVKLVRERDVFRKMVETMQGEKR